MLTSKILLPALALGAMQIISGMIMDVILFGLFVGWVWFLYQQK